MPTLSINGELDDNAPHVTVIRMPEMDGLEFIRRIRTAGASDQYSVAVASFQFPVSSDQYQPVIIATSASVYYEDRQQCIEAGSQAFLPKPIDADLLFEQLQELLSVEWVYQDEPQAGDESSMPLPSSTFLIGRRSVRH